MITISQRTTNSIVNRQPVDQRTLVIVSDSSQIPSQSQRLWFTQDQRKLSYKGEQVGGSFKRVITDSDAQGAVGEWYLCTSNVDIRLPVKHSQKDAVRVSTVMSANSVRIYPANLDTIQSDSGFQLNVPQGSAEFVWDGVKWVVAQVAIPGHATGFQIVQHLPAVGQQKLYYNRQDNKLYYWDSIWREIAGASSPAGYSSYIYGIDHDTSIATAASACRRVVLNPQHDSDSDQLRYTVVQKFAKMPAHNFKRCVMDDLANRHINYYLDSMDSTKKADGTPADLTGGDGDVMVQIPICHYRLDTYTDQSNHVHHVYLVSDKPFAGSKIHRYFYVSPGGATARVQYVGAFRDVLCNADGTIKAQSSEGTPAYYGLGNKFRSVAGARPSGYPTRAVFRTGSVSNGGTNVNAMFGQYLMMMMAIDGCTFDTQTGISIGYSQLSQFSYAAVRKTGRTAIFGNGTGEILADETETTGEDLDLLTMKDGGTIWKSAAQNDASLKVVQFSYRGIEDPYGAQWFFEDGIQKYQNATENDFSQSGYWCTNDTSKYSLCDSDMDAGAHGGVFPNAGYTGASYAWVSHAFPKSMGFVKEFDPMTFFALSLDGGSSTYLCDYIYNDINAGARILYRGGSDFNGTGGGGGCVSVNSGFAASDASIGGRLAC